MSHPVNEYVDDIPMRLDIRYQPLDFGIYLDEAALVFEQINDEKYKSLLLEYKFDLENKALEHVNQLLQKYHQLSESKDHLDNRSDILDVEPLQPQNISPLPSQTTSAFDSSSVQCLHTQIENANCDLISSGSFDHGVIAAATAAHHNRQQAIITDFHPLSPSISSPQNSLNLNDHKESREKTKDQKKEGLGQNEIIAPITATATPASSVPAANLVNPCDFEDINYTPFDHVELQTIDDLRELNLIFQKSYASDNSQTN